MDEREAENLLPQDVDTLIANPPVVNSQIIEQILALSTDDPDYPLPLGREQIGFKESFDDIYEKAGGTFEAYARKYIVARAFITRLATRVLPENGSSRGLNTKLRFFANKFARPEEELSEEVERLKDDLSLKVREALLQRGDPRETTQAARELTDFAQEVAQGRSIDSQNFRKLVGLFGSSRVVDILYRTRPEFRGVPVDQVTSVLADYLGDFLVVKGSFNPDDVRVGLEHLSDPNLQEGLLEVLKDSCLAYYNNIKKAYPDQTDKTIIGEYFDVVDLEIDGFDNQLLKDVAQRARDYYTSVLSRVKPEQIVDALKAGRKFPDLNQMINAQEVEEKRRVLVADEMGLGKSFSVILTKESLGLKQALVVIPSNVISSWQEFLSDRVDENGKQIGYFKVGRAPRVLVVESPADLQKDTNAFDYVLISHERLNEAYMPYLENLDFDMLIVDEVHKLKNLVEGVRAGNLLKLASKVEQDDSYLALLSGTPVPNKVKDVAMILKLLYPDRFSEVDDKDLVRRIIYGDLVDLRSLLIPRMQMKGLRESIDIPDLTEEEFWFYLNADEQEIYDVLMEEDEIEAKDKIRILRQFIVNPELLDITPETPGSKITNVGRYLQEAFKTKDKVVMFVNGYIENVLRGEKNIISKLGLPRDIEIRVIMGGVSREERENIQRELRESGKRILLLVSGQTADVGVDFSAADTADFYNEPWTKYDKKQQLGRVDREGLEHTLQSTTFIARNTIEEGIHRYIEIKYNAIEKLLRGIPITDLEKELLEKGEDQDEVNLEVNPELAEYYVSSWNRLMKFWGYVKNLGEVRFKEFLTLYGEDYAQCYLDLGSRSYQANASRVSATLVDKLITNNGLPADNLKILDIASGPEMLKRHIADQYQDKVISLDINAHHFKPGSKAVVGSFLALPFQSGSIDIANLNLALHYTKFIPSRGEFERLDVLREINRVLKMSGTAVINLMYSLDLRDLDKFKKVAQAAGLTFQEDYSGEVTVGNRYRSRVITLVKTADIGLSTGDLAEEIGKENFDGLKFVENNRSLSNPRRTIRQFEIDGKEVPVIFNPTDYQILLEEEELYSQGERLKIKYAGVENIPVDEVITNGFTRVRLLEGKKYVLFKRLTLGSGAVVVK